MWGVMYFWRGFRRDSVKKDILHMTTRGTCGPPKTPLPHIRILNLIFSYFSTVVFKSHFFNLKKRPPLTFDP